MSGGDDYAALREKMVRDDILGRGIRDSLVVSAFRRVPREKFVPEEFLGEAYDDHPLQIGAGQTVSQPYIVAVMLEAVRPTREGRALEIGTGSGYQTALLAEMFREVYTVERLPELAQSARARLDGMGYRNVRYRVGDGTLGWIEEAPYDAVIVSAAAPEAPASLEEQLADSGRMVTPIGDQHRQTLVVVERRGTERAKRRRLCDCVFVKLIGEEGWGEKNAE